MSLSIAENEINQNIMNLKVLLFFNMISLLHSKIFIEHLLLPGLARSEASVNKRALTLHSWGSTVSLLAYSRINKYND